MYLYPAQDKEYLITTSVSALFFISCSLCSIVSSVCAWRTRITLFTCVRRCILSHTSTIRHSWPQLKGLRVNIIDCWSRLCSAGKHAHRETLVNGLLRWSPADNIISFGQGPDGSTCRNTHTEVHTHTHSLKATSQRHCWFPLRNNRLWDRQGETKGMRGGGRGDMTNGWGAAR